MVREELVRRSPVRILESSTHGGIAAGQIGVIAARHGVGKTACLVHIAIDRLLGGKRVIHISFSRTPQHVLAWYENVFSEIASQKSLDNAMAVHDEIMKNRVVMSYKQNGLHITQIESSLQRMIDQGGFSADTLVIDGYDLGISDGDELREFADFASRLGLELWFSVSLQEPAGQADTLAYLENVAQQIAVIIHMEPRGDFVHLSLLKDHDNETTEEIHLKLDPGTLLIAEES